MNFSKLKMTLKYGCSLCLVLMSSMVESQTSNQVAAQVPVLSLLLDDNSDQSTVSKGNLRIAQVETFRETAPTGLQSRRTFTYNAEGFDTVSQIVGFIGATGTLNINSSYHDDASPNTVTFSGTGLLGSDPQTDTYFYQEGSPLLRLEAVGNDGITSIFTPTFSNGRLTSAAVVTSGTGITTTTEAHTYSYNSDGRISRRTIDSSISGSDSVTNFTYDNTGFLTSAVRTTSTTRIDSTFEWQTATKHVETFEFRSNGTLLLRSRIESTYESGDCIIRGADDPVSIISVIQGGTPVSRNVNCGNL